MPVAAIFVGVALNAAIFFAILPEPRQVWTALFGVTSIGLAYEWTHFLIHTSYAPRGAVYRNLWRLHRLHHYKNEDYWFGVTGHLGDRVLGTAPDPKDVPLSPTARTLEAA
jgi:sterol desaturase/sphingolipid hydroxylase (fatty acid hydroxylase superfamily)